MIRCNEEGIPKLVQSISYYREAGENRYKCKLFNGGEVNILVYDESMIGSNDPESPVNMANAEYCLLEGYSPQSLIDISH